MRDRMRTGGMLGLVAAPWDALDGWNRPLRLLGLLACYALGLMLSGIELNESERTVAMLLPGLVLAVSMVASMDRNLEEETQAAIEEAGLASGLGLSQTWKE